MTSPEQVPTPTTITPITFPAGQETRTKILSGLRQGQDVILKSSTSGEVCLSSVAKDSATDYFTLSGSECDLPEGFAIRLSGSSAPISSVTKKLQPSHLHCRITVCST